MERRCYSRVLARVTLILYQSALPTAIARVTEVSEAGLFAETRFTDVTFGQALDVELPLRLALGHYPVRFTAQPVRRTSRGLALFVGPDQQQARKALALMVAHYASGQTPSVPLNAIA